MTLEIICESCQARDHGHCAERWCSWCDCPCNAEGTAHAEAATNIAHRLLDDLADAVIARCDRPERCTSVDACAFPRCQAGVVTDWRP